MLYSTKKQGVNYLLILCVFLLSLSSCKRSTPMEPVSLNNEIATLQGKIVEAFEAYSDAAVAKDEEQIRMKRHALNEVAQKNIEIANKYVLSTDNEPFIKAAKDNFEFYQSITTKDLVMIERWYLADSITVEQNDSLAIVLRDINRKEDELDKRFKLEQKSFAEKNNFQLTE